MKYLIQFGVAFVFLYAFVLLSMAQYMAANTKNWAKANFWNKMQILYIQPTVYLTVILTAAHNVLLWVGL